MRLPLNQTVLLAFVLALFQPWPTHAQTSPSKSVSSDINSYTAEVDRFIKVNKKHRIFGDVSSDLTNDRSDWKEFKSQKELDDNGEVYQSAFVWTRKGGVVAANFTFTSASGDWAHYIEYYFREDGSLAKIQAQLNTFYGDISVVRHRYYGSTGRLVKSTRKFLDLDTHKPKKPSDFTDEPIPVYLKVSDLPFRKLL